MTAKCNNHLAGELKKLKKSQKIVKFTFLRPMPREEAPVINRQPERDDSFQQQGGLNNRYGDVWK